MAVSAAGSVPMTNEPPESRTIPVGGGRTALRCRRYITVNSVTMLMTPAPLASHSGRRVDCPRRDMGTALAASDSRRPLMASGGLMLGGEERGGSDGDKIGAMALAIAVTF